MVRLPWYLRTTGDHLCRSVLLIGNAGLESDLVGGVELLQCADVAIFPEETLQADQT